MKLKNVIFHHRFQQFRYSFIFGESAVAHGDSHPIEIAVAVHGILVEESEFIGLDNFLMYNLMIKIAKGGRLIGITISGSNLVDFVKSVV